MYPKRVLILLLVSVSCSSALGQLFGSARQLGRPLQQRPGGANEAPVDAGNVQGNERFLRNNRRRGDFVGSDRFEPKGFVGSGQGSTNGPVIPSTLGVQPARDQSRRINQPLPRLQRKQAYRPRYELAFTSSPAELPAPSALKAELENPVYFSAANRFEVWVEGRRATLRGVVVDAQQRDLVELLVSFEPGISEVKNQLRVQEDLSNLPEPGE